MRIAPLISVISLMFAQLPAMAAAKDGPGDEGSSAVSDLIDQYNVVRTTPSKNAGESMPVGGGDVGINVWVENNELLFYIGRAGRANASRIIPTP